MTMHPALLINGSPVSLDHLKPITRTIALELRGDIKKTVAVEIKFSCHCYSRGVKEDETPHEALVIKDGQRLRVFDDERYELSKGLVELIDRLIVNNDIVSKSRHDNFYRVDHVQTLRNGEVKSVSYFIFMRARKIQEPNRPKTLKVFVESAYPEQDSIPHPISAGRKSFGEMLGETWTQKG